MSHYCPACGALIPEGFDDCQSLWDELRYAQGMAAAPSLSEAAFDAYCMQHLEKYCCSAKSYAAHLTRLCCGVEHGGDPSLYAAIQRWLNGSPPLEKPAILPALGTMTVADLYNAATTDERLRLERAWIETVWAAYAPQHELARRWIDQAWGRR